MIGTFLAPLFLIAGLAALVPIVLHLARRLRTVEVPFSTIRFLRLAHRASSRRSKVENLLLLLLRVCLVLALALAFAVPVLKMGSFAGLGSRTHRDVAIVMDVSYSMNYQLAAGTAWEQAVQAAAAAVDELAPGDRVCVFLAEQNARPLIEHLTPDRAFVIDQLRALKPGWAGSDLQAAVAAAGEALRQQAGNRETEMYILTDGQALAWSGFRKREPAGPDRPPRGGVKDTACFVVFTGAALPENAAARDIAITPPLVLSNTECRIAATLIHTGARNAMAASLLLDGREIGQRGGFLGNEETGGQIVFQLPPLAPGIHTGAIATPPDHLPEDDTFYFLLRVRDKFPSLCVGSTQDTFFVTRALSPGADTQCTVRRADAASLPREPLAPYTCVFLCNALPLPGQAIVALQHYVEGGGLMVLFPGDGAAAGDYRSWSCLPGLPSAVQEVPVAQRKKILRWDAPRHPILKELPFGAGGAPVVVVKRQAQWGDLAGDAQTLISAGAGNPFLLCRGIGAGRVLAFSVSADRSWSDLPLSPFFLPMIHQIVRYGAGAELPPAYVSVGESVLLAAHAPAATARSALLDPRDRPVPIRTSTADGRSILYADELTVPGIYRVQMAPGAEPEPALAANLPRAEADLTPLRKQDVRDLLGARHVAVAGDKEDLLRLVREHRGGRMLAEQLLWLAFVLAVIEIVYANRRSQAVGGLSETLDLEPSGRIRNLLRR